MIYVKYCPMLNGLCGDNSSPTLYCEYRLGALDAKHISSMSNSIWSMHLACLG